MTNKKAVNTLDHFVHSDGRQWFRFNGRVILESTKELSEQESILQLAEKLKIKPMATTALFTDRTVLRLTHPQFVRPNETRPLKKKTVSV